jgi:cytochrome oxidase Cu insertion factor (SCO1/SenC/PrrC family)
LKDAYSGVIGDRLLLTAVRGLVRGRDSTDNYLDSAIHVVKDPYALSLLEKQRRIFGKRVPAFNFTLKDTVGREVSLAHFRGKVVVLDFYFTGCSACIGLNQVMENVMHKFEGDSNVVFVSVDLDERMSMFRSAVRSGKYSHSTSVNLYTNGEGGDHPLAKHYEVEYCPRMMIIDAEGKMLEGDPPFPKDEVSVDKFCNIILSGMK